MKDDQPFHKGLRNFPNAIIPRRRPHRATGEGEGPIVAKEVFEVAGGLLMSKSPACRRLARLAIRLVVERDKLAASVAASVAVDRARGGVG